VEGPDHTIKLPANVDAHLQKISDVVAAHPVGGPLLPDFHALVVELIADLEKEPRPFELEGDDGPEIYFLTADDMRRVVAGMIGRRFSIQFIVEDFAPLAADDFTHMAGVFPGFRTTRENAMRAVIDCASGLSAARRSLIEEQVQDSLLGTAADFPYPEVCEAWGIEDLGDDFRSPVQSSVPALFISGDLDGRTPISNASEVQRGFPTSAHIVVEGVGHEGFVFFASPELVPLIGEFFAGAMPASRRLTGPALEFTLPTGRVASVHQP
jgi:pimeloyl-ACP methyl ester carboxylesterase